MENEKLAAELEVAALELDRLRELGNSAEEILSEKVQFLDTHSHTQCTTLKLVRFLRMLHTSPPNPLFRTVFFRPSLLQNLNDCNAEFCCAGSG